MSDPISFPPVTEHKFQIPHVIGDLLDAVDIDLDDITNLTQEMNSNDVKPPIKFVLKPLVERRPEYEFLPPTSFQPYIGLSHNWNSLGGILDGIQTDFPETDSSGQYEATVSGLSTATNNNPEVFLGFEYRNWDLANSPGLQDRHIYRQIGPTLGLRTQLGRYDVEDYSYTAILDPSDIEDQLLDGGQDMALAAAIGDYNSINTILSTMFEDFDIGDTIHGYDSKEYHDTWRWQLDGRIGAGSAVYRAQSPVGVLEHFDIGMTGSMTAMNNKFFLGIGVYSDAGILRLGHNPKLELLAEGLVRFHAMPSSDESYMLEAGLGLNLRASINVKRSGNPKQLE